MPKMVMQRTEHCASRCAIHVLDFSLPSALMRPLAASLALSPPSTVVRDTTISAMAFSSTSFTNLFLETLLPSLSLLSPFLLIVKCVIAT